MKSADLWLYVGVAVCTQLSVSFQTNEAMDYLQPKALFYIRAAIAALGAGLLAAKMYRSTSYADQKKKDEDTQFLSRQQPKGIQ